MTVVSHGMPQPDPEPFRREDAIRGREHSYDDVTFLHRFTYRYRPERAEAWRERPQGLRGSAGSVKTREFFVTADFRKTFELDNRFFAEYRYRLDEDFDGDYERNVVGAGVRLPGGWSLASLGQFERAKENVDAYFEAAWEGTGGRRARGGLVLADAVYNRKTDDTDYERMPHTWFTAWDWAWNEGTKVGGWVNWTPEIALSIGEDRFTYDQFSWSAYGLRRLGADWTLRVEARGEEGYRHLTAANALQSRRRVDRRHWEGGLEVERCLGDAWAVWGGARVLHFDEEDERPEDAERDAVYRRRERMAHGGLNWRVHPRVLVWPGVYWMWPNNSERFAQQPLSDTAATDALAKAAFPIEIGFASGATLTLNTSIRLDKPRSGGGNAQIQIPW